MRKIALGLACFLLTVSAWADNSYEPLLNMVTLQLNAEQWVTTKTALVTAGVNASVSGAALDKAQGDILNKLNQISKGDWHLVSFARSLDQSGLERVQISAEARLPSSELANLRDKAKKISVPGETYTIDNIAYTPSAEEFRDANTALRNDIYQQITAELASLNKVYPDQRYFVHSVNFMGELAVPQPQMAMYKVAAAGEAASMNRNLSVGDKLRIMATVVLAAAPNADVAKVVHN